eukprot:gene12220-14431_t
MSEIMLNLRAANSLAQAVAFVKLLNSNHLLISGSADRTLRVWDTVTRQQTQATEAAVGCANGMVMLVDTASCAVLQRLPGHSSEVHGVSWCPGLPSGTVHQRLATGGRDRMIHLWVWGEDGEVQLEQSLQLPRAHGNLSEAQRGRLWLSL